MIGLGSSRRSVRAMAALALVPLATAGAAAGSGAAAPVPAVTSTVATGLKAPWGLAFLPDGSALVSERDSARVKRLDGRGGVRTVGTVPGVRHTSEGGLLGIAVAADFAAHREVYAYLTAAKDNRIVRMTYTNGRLGGPKVVLAGIPAGAIHNGGRIVFGPDGMLYAGTGETGDRGLAPRPGSLGGKILRLTRTGKVPADNPTKGSYVFSRGHRNVQGLAFDAKGRLFASEFGQNTWDELNLIRPGRNDGWPTVEGRAGDKRYDDPIAQWKTSEASPSGVAIVGRTVFMAALRGQRLWRITIGATGRSGIPTATSKAFFTGEYGRLRTVAPAPDGSLWLVTNNTDRRGVPRIGDDRVLRLKLK
jgi:glucose/arabinose dehydrogenase